MREAGTLAVLGLVLVASILNQLPIRRWHELVGRFDRWTFLPFWGFFGPRPAHAGVHVIYRDRADGGWMKWSEVAIPPMSRWRWVWNPAKHERKALHDLLNGLAQVAEEVQDEGKVVLCNCHLALLAWVMAQARRASDATCRQFALVETTGHGAGRSVRPVFISREYRLD